MNNSEKYIKSEARYMMGTYSRHKIVPEYGKGATITDVDGKEYIDFGAGIAVSALGHGDEGYLAAVERQLRKIVHTSNYYYNIPGTELAELLVKTTGLDKVFLCNSGAEANECAVKIARKYSADKFSNDRYEIITLKNSFHGRTLTTLAATGQEGFHKDFTPLTPGFISVEANIDSVREAFSEKTCAVMMELIQGEGGVNVLPKDFVLEVFRFCKDNDLLLIVDEVQTGVGRTGRFLASELYDISPDIITLAKGLGGGLPIGAVLAGKKCSDTLTAGLHGSTFGGNPVAAAGAVEIIKRISDKNFLSEVNKKSIYIKQRLFSFRNVCRVRGMGLLLGFDLESGNAKAAAAEMNSSGVLVLTAQNSIRLAPPLTITKSEIDSGLAIIKNISESI